MDIIIDIFVFVLLLFSAIPGLMLIGYLWEKMNDEFPEPRMRKPRKKNLREHERTIESISSARRPVGKARKRENERTGRVEGGKAVESNQ